MNQESKPSILKSILQDPVISEAVDEDPFIRFIIKWWIHILVVVGAVVLGFYARQQFHSNYTSRMGEAGDLYLQVSQEYENYLRLQEELVGVEEKEKENTGEKPSKDKDLGLEDLQKQRTLLQDNIRKSSESLNAYLTALADSNQPYSGLVSLYKGLLARGEGQTREAVELLKGDSSNEKGATNKPIDFYDELKVLVRAKTLLDEEGGTAEGRALLISLAEKAEYVRVVAAVSLARVSVSEDEKKEASMILKSVANNYPEQASIIEEETRRLLSG